jgi:trk system potassium uptake protein TrkA
MLQHNSIIEYGIIGLGRFGCALTKNLAASGKEILAIDTFESRVNQIRNYTDSAFVVSSFDK